jgi:hypothetical protein
MYDKTSQQLWIDSQELLVKELELRQNYLIENIKIMLLAIDNNSIQLEYEKKSLNDYKNELNL